MKPRRTQSEPCFPSPVSVPITCSDHVQQQLDGANHFPSIDTVISAFHPSDKSRVVGESEFYEHKDASGILRRRSIMRTVDKDDLLVARGANPRTGLITPDANSIAGSLSDERPQAAQIKVPSAQWKMEGDQWVSIVQGLDEPDHAASTTLSPHVVQSRSPSDTLNVNKVRRKEVGSPPKSRLQTSAPPHGRFASDETVIRTPFASDRLPKDYTRLSYFSPDDIGRELPPKKGNRTKFQAEDMSFLDVPVKARQMMIGQTRAFTDTRIKRDQLQQSLRTSSGRFPSPHLTSQNVATDDYSDLLQPQPSSRIDKRAHLYHEDPAHTVPRVYLPDTAIYYGHAPLPQHFTRSFKAHRTDVRTQCPMATQRNDLANGRQHLNLVRSPSMSQNFDVVSMGNQICPHTFREQVVDSGDQHQSGDISSRHATSRVYNQGNAEVNTGAMRPNEISYRDHDRTHPHGVSRAARPLFGQRSHKSNRVPQRTVQETTMESERRSKWTGTKKSGQEEAQDADGQELHQDEKNSAHPTGAGTPVQPKLPSNSDVVMRLSPVNNSDYKETDLRDHSICCPNCCVQFDCHEGCLGHPSPDNNNSGNETSSLVSMGVFDASFETSVNAVNKALLETRDRCDSKLTKLRTAFGGNLWFSGGDSPSKSGKAIQMSASNLGAVKKYDKGSSEKEAQSTSKGPRNRVNGQAKTAAKRAMGLGSISGEMAKGLGTSKNTLEANIRSPVDESTQLHAMNEANEGRKLHARSEECQPDPDLTATEGAKAETGVHKDPTSCADLETPVPELDDDDRKNVPSRMSALVRRKSIHWPRSETNSAVLNYALLAISGVKEMTATVLETFSIVSCMIFDYRRTGIVVLPQSTSVSELAANCLRSVLYLMIAVCIYALAIKILRVVLVVVRVLLLPVRLCAWVLG